MHVRGRGVKRNYKDGPGPALPPHPHAPTVASNRSLHAPNPRLQLVKRGTPTCLQGLVRGLSNNNQLLFSVYYAPGAILSVLRASPPLLNHHNRSLRRCYRPLHCTRKDTGTRGHQCSGPQSGVVGPGHLRPAGLGATC